MSERERKAELVHVAARRFLKHEINHRVWFSEGAGPNSVLFINYGYQSPSGVWEREALQIRLGNWRERKSLRHIVTEINNAISQLPWADLRNETFLTKENKARRAIRNDAHLKALLDE